MLNRGTLPSRLDLLALSGQELAVPTEEIWRAVRAGNSAALADVARVYVPRLDHYLSAGLSILDPDVRDAIITGAMMPLNELDHTDDPSRLEMRLYRLVRGRARQAGFESYHPPMAPASPGQLELGLELLKSNMLSASTATCENAEGEGREARDVIAFAARVARAAVATPVWFADTEFLARTAHARAIYEAVMDAAADRAPPCLAPSEVRTRAREIRHAFDQVWLALPQPTREARTLWGLNVAVSEIAEILGVSVAAADSALLQLLTITTAFNALIGGTPASLVPEVAAFATVAFPTEECP